MANWKRHGIAMAVESGPRFGYSLHCIDTQHAAIWLRSLANDGGNWEEVGCSTQQDASQDYYIQYRLLKRATTEL